MLSVRVSMPGSCGMEDTARALKGMIRITKCRNLGDSIQIDGELCHTDSNPDEEANVIASIIWDVNGPCEVEVSIKHRYRYFEEDARRFIVDKVKCDSK